MHCKRTAPHVTAYASHHLRPRIGRACSAVAELEVVRRFRALTSNTIKNLPLIVLALALLVGCTATNPSLARHTQSTAGGTPKEDQGYSKRILGRWLGPTKFFTFHANGTWALQRNEGAPPDTEGRRWHIAGNKLTLTYPGGCSTDTIVSFTRTRFVPRDEGHSRVYERDSL